MSGAGIVMTGEPKVHPDAKAMSARRKAAGDSGREAVRILKRRLPTSSTERDKPREEHVGFGSAEGHLRQHAAEFVGEAARRTWSNGAGALFAVVAQHSTDPVGSMSVLALHEGVAALGYWTVPAARRRGHMTHTLRRLTTWCVNDRGVARVELAIEDANVASRRLAARAGSPRKEPSGSACCCAAGVSTS
jgi:RimJ/RimL family protein N-acetyltransferase